MRKRQGFFGRDNQLAARQSGNRFANDGLGSIRLRGIEKIHPEVNCLANQ
jgi:hypothetical protein